MYWCIFVLFWIIFVFFCLKLCLIFQFLLFNFVFLGVCFLFLFFCCLLLESLRLPFDYLECESELVCGLYTEFSGFFFVLFSLCELNFGFLMSLFFLIMCFGGLFLCFKLLFCLFFVWVMPRVLLFRMRLNVCYVFVCFYLSFVLSFMFLLLWLYRFFVLF